MDKVVQLPAKPRPKRFVRAIAMHGPNLVTIRKGAAFLIHSSRGFILAMPFRAMGSHLGAPANEA